MGGRGVNGVLSGSDSIWGIGSEEGFASEVGIFAIRYEIWSFDRVTRTEVRLYLSVFVRIPIWLVTSSHHLLMLGSISREPRSMGGRKEIRSDEHTQNHDQTRPGREVKEM